MERIHWNQYFLAIAKIAALRSGCNSRPTGAIITCENRIIATGYNGTIKGKEQCTDKGNNYCKRRSVMKDEKGSEKYFECPSIHAEQNAINQLATYQGVIQGKQLTMYCTLFPCVLCLKNIASIGIKKVIYELSYTSKNSIRDKYWIEEANKTGIVFEKLEIERDYQMMIWESIQFPTSYRRFKGES